MGPKFPVLIWMSVLLPGALSVLEATSQSNLSFSPVVHLTTPAHLSTQSSSSFRGTYRSKTSTAERQRGQPDPPALDQAFQRQSPIDPLVQRRRAVVAAHRWTESSLVCQILLLAGQRSTAADRQTATSIERYLPQTQHRNPGGPRLHDSTRLSGVDPRKLPGE